MFDKYSIDRSTSTAVPYAKTVTVNENRAATDESIRLFMEMRDKAQETLLDSFVISIADVDVVVNTYMDHIYQNIIVLYKFNINGNDITDRVIVPAVRFSKDNYERAEEIMDVVVEEAAKKLANSLRLLATVKVANTINN